MLKLSQKCLLPVDNQRKQHQMRHKHSMPAGWFPDPWDLSGTALQERWWTGLIWADRTRQITKTLDRDNISVVEPKEN